MPITWIIIAFAIGFWGKQKWRSRGLKIGFGLFLLFTNPLLQNESMMAWEKDVVPMEEVNKHRYGVVLTGITNTRKEPRDRIYFSKGADRITMALQLYREGKIDKIIITGGGGDVIGPNIKESILLKDFLLMAKIPSEDILIEDQAKNTRENATFTAELLDSLNETQPVLLITSAFHMRRSIGCFEKAGVSVTPFPVDYHSSDRFFTPNFIIIPNEKALAEWGVLIHEVVGYVVYKLIGYA